MAFEADAPKRADREAGAACRWGFWASVAAWLVLLLLIAHGAGPWSPRAYEAQLKDQVEDALRRAGLGGVQVEMDGQRARLGGLAGTEAQRVLAERVALTAAGRGGAWWGGVTQVDNEVLTGQPVRPFTWSITKDAQGVRMEGHAPSARARDLLRERAQAAFKAPVSGDLTIAAGAPDGMWVEVASRALTQVAQLQRGSARLEDRALTVIGEAGPAVRDAVTQYFAVSHPPDYPAPRLDIEAAGEGIAARPELAGINLITAAPDDCQRAFEALMQGKVIQFETNSAEVSASSRALVADLAAVARRCDRFTIKVEGHTDNLGVRDLNMRLSQDRAAAVVNVLLAEGVSPARVSAVGLGPDRPIANNRTREGQAANRRITFVVTP